MTTASKKQGKYGPMIDLREMEEEVLAEASEWAKRRMEEKLREKAAAFSPGRPKNAPKRPTPESNA